MSAPKTDAEIASMRKGGAMLTAVLDLLERSVAPGMTGKDLAKLAKNELERLGGEPAFLGVQGMPGHQDFPDVICISIAEEVQHGIPSNRVLKEGDAVNCDFGVLVDGLITDAGRTFAVGEVNADTQRLLTGTKKALAAGVAKVKAGTTVGEIAGAIEDVLEAHQLGIVLELVGHGVGHSLHEEPEIPNYRFKGKGSNYVLQENETICIEPIATLGSGEIYIDSDGWTIMSADDTQSAQFEHTLRVTKTGSEKIAG